MIINNNNNSRINWRTVTQFLCLGTLFFIYIIEIIIGLEITNINDIKYLYYVLRSFLLINTTTLICSFIFCRFNTCMKVTTLFTYLILYLTDMILFIISMDYAQYFTNSIFFILYIVSILIICLFILLYICIHVPQNNQLQQNNMLQQYEMRSISVVIVNDKDSAENDICSICLDSYKTNEKIKILSCVHRFHESCINVWLEQNIVCPLCKQRLTIIIN